MSIDGSRDITPAASPAPLDRASAFAQIAQSLMGCSGIQQTLDEVVGTAAAVIERCEHAGVMILGPGRQITSPAVTSSLVRACDNAQFEYREGPCLRAATTSAVVVRAPDLATDERWPRFGAAAAALGIKSMLSCQLATHGDRIGALSLYAGVPNAFDDFSVELGSIFAVHASIAVASARLEEQLRAAVESRGVIGQAVGMLIERHGFAAADAFELLKRVSQHRNVKLRTLAEAVVLGRVDPFDPA